MADAQITPPDIEYPDVSDLLEQIPDISDIHSFIETQKNTFRQENQSISLDIPDELALKYGDNTKFKACSLMIAKLNKEMLNIQIQYQSMQIPMLKLITSILNEIVIPKNKRKSILMEKMRTIGEINGGGNNDNDSIHTGSNSDDFNNYMNEKINFNLLWKIVENIDLKKFELLNVDALPEALKSYMSKDKDVDLNVLIKCEVINQISIIAPHISIKLFALCEQLQTLIETYDLFNSIQKIKTMKQDLNIHCIYHIPYVFTFDNHFIIPVDKFDGNFRVYRINQFKKKFKILEAQESKSFLAKLDAEYQQYVKFIHNAVRYIEIKIQRSSQTPSLSYQL